MSGSVKVHIKVMNELEVFPLICLDEMLVLQCTCDLCKDHALKEIVQKWWGQIMHRIVANIAAKWMFEEMVISCCELKGSK